MNPLFHTEFSISDSLKNVRKSVLIYETIILSLLYNRSLSPKEISNILDIPKQQTNKILENLEKENYIIRQKGVASDARVTQISISENGKSLLLNTLDAFSQYLNSYLIALSPNEQKILKKFFDHIDKKIIF